MSGLSFSISFFETFLWSNVFPFHIQIFEYLAREAWALPMLAGQIAYRPRQRPQGQKCLIHLFLVHISRVRWKTKYLNTELSHSMYDTYRHFSELVAIFGSDLCNPYFIKMGGENMGVGAIFGSDFHKSAMNSWQEGRSNGGTTNRVSL